MAFKLENLAFLYEMREEGFSHPDVRVIVYKDGRVRWLSYEMDEDEYEERDSSEHYLQLDEQAMKRLMKQLSNNARVESFARIENPLEDWGQESQFQLYVNNGTTKLQKKGLDWQYICGRGKRRALYPVVNDFFAFLREVGKVLVEPGVDKSCFLPPMKRYDKPWDDEPEIEETFVVYDWRKAEVQRGRGDCRLEHYYFHRYSDGTYQFEYQEGWSAGSHMDGGTAMNDIPKKWLELPWEVFVDKFIRKYPAKDYCIERAELLSNKKLRKFLLGK